MLRTVRYHTDGRFTVCSAHLDVSSVIYAASLVLNQRDHSQQRNHRKRERAELQYREWGFDVHTDRMRLTTNLAEGVRKPLQPEKKHRVYNLSLLGNPSRIKLRYRPLNMREGF